MTPKLDFIGFINTPYEHIEECPHNIQLNGPLCEINLYPPYHSGLQGLKEGQHIMILYWLENTDRSAISQEKCGGKGRTGTFSLRSPNRPNPIGVAVLKIEKMELGKIIVKGLDCLNQTSLLDIKPAIYKEVP